MQIYICLPWTVKMPIEAIKNILSQKIFEDNKQQEIMTE